MEYPTPHKQRPIARNPGQRLTPARDRLVVRKRAERATARARIARQTRQPLTAAQIAFDPLARRSHRRGRRTAAFWAAVFGSLVLHIVAVGAGFLMRGRQGATTAREDVKIEVRQRPPEPPPEKTPEPPAPIEKPARTPPKVVKAPPPSAPPPPPTKTPPVRVVGLSLESTTEGGSGPSFAVGNTRFGETDKKAVAPKDVSAAPPGLDPNATEARGPGKSNQAASRIPVAGVRYEMPKRLRERKPDYPPLLKTQGIEGDVTVLVSVDATGKVTAVKIIKPSEYPEMNENARRCALTEEFTPATRDGLAIPYSLSFTYRFRLEEE